MQPLNVTMIQAATHWHDPLANREMFEEYFASVPAEAQIVMLPEMFSTGFTMASVEVAEAMTGETVGWMTAAATDLGKVLCGSVVIQDRGDRFNRFVWATPDGQIQTYDKRHRFRMAGEHEHYAAGEERAVFELGEWRICPMVCYDLRFPVWFRNRDDYDAIVCVANWPAARQDAWNSLLKARAIENQAYVVGCNIVGQDGNGIEYSGGSAAYAPDGTVLVERFGTAQLIDVTLDGDLLEAQRESFPVWQDADEFELHP